MVETGSIKELRKKNYWFLKYVKPLLLLFINCLLLLLKNAPLLKTRLKPFRKFSNNNPYEKKKIAHDYLRVILNI